MKKISTIRMKVVFSTIAAICFNILIPFHTFAQQWVIENKDRTRPVEFLQTSAPLNTNISTLNAPVISPSFSNAEIIRNNGYHEIHWSTMNESNVRKFIVEYSVNGTDYLEAGQSIPTGKAYTVNHYTDDSRPMLYRLKTEYSNRQFSYSSPVMLDGVAQSPVRVYPTLVETNRINANASWPVEQVNIVSLDGRQVFTKSMNGQSDFIPINIPDLAQGMYLVTFYGRGWQTTSKIQVNK